jgi:hypothetical protein
VCANWVFLGPLHLEIIKTRVFTKSLCVEAIFLCETHARGPQADLQLKNGAEYDLLYLSVSVQGLLRGLLSEVGIAMRGADHIVGAATDHCIAGITGMDAVLGQGKSSRGDAGGHHGFAVLV